MTMIGQVGSSTRTQPFGGVTIDDIPAAADVLRCSPWDLLAALVAASAD